MAYTAQEVAHYVITKCVNDGYPISNLQLQKILYFLQVASIRAGRGVAFEDEMEAWQYGPVIPAVYYEFGRYGAMPIIATYSDMCISGPDRELFDPVIVSCYKKTAWQLVEESHREGGAWKRIYGGAVTRRTISKEVLEQYG